MAKNTRTVTKPSKTRFCYIYEFPFLQAQIDLGLAPSGTVTTTRKYTPPPIDISDLPGVENLTTAEKEVRIFDKGSKFHPGAVNCVSGLTVRVTDITVI